MKLIFADILKELKASGYNVKARLMNAMYYNVPQSRQRIIFIGVRKDLKIEPSHPKPESKPIPLKECILDLKNNNEENRKLSPLVQEIAKYQPQKWSSDKTIYKQIKGNLAGSISLKWGMWNKVSNTLMKSEISLTGVVHPDRKRYLNCSEYKRIASFPDDFKFIDRDSCIQRIGNAVPPNLMKAIAIHIKENILTKT
jgi:DNA (cytosine-5)-methyltransferase 1